MWIKCRVEWHEETDNRMTALFNYRHGESFQRRKSEHWANADLYPTDLFVKLGGRIIATSNLYLNKLDIPKLSDGFIGSFCKNRFDEIMVEFDDNDKYPKLIDGFIVVKPVKTTWTKGEIKNFIHQEFMGYMNYYLDNGVFPLDSQIDKWLEENLQ